MTTALVIHGHFYQPPRENPWTDIVDREPGAHPFHDWNERIHAECYRPNGWARIIDSFGRVERIINNYTNISFNFGPTLLSWLERHYPETYARILEADRESVLKRNGHGNAIAQGYNHTILTLCNERDRRTQVRWGIADFRYRFGREPEALWLPETACNDETLGTLIDEGLKFVILAPYQAERIRPIGVKVWWNVVDGSIDPAIPYKYFHRDGSGRSIAVFFYDGHIAKAIAFDGVLASSHALVDHFERAVISGGQIVNVATDGESYGHHFHFGDRCLAYALEVEAESRGFWVTNYGEFLEHHPPMWEVEIKRGPGGEGTAWSCAHGVGRWRRDCSCHAGAMAGWNQAWREPLREALDYLRDEAALQYESAAGELFRDPWEARDAYIELILDRTRSREEFLYRQTGRFLKPREQVRALTLLELQRSAMVMYTSCGWFFNDISGIETVQILRYAGRVIQLMNELNLPSPHRPFLEILAQAQSNIPEMGHGAGIFRRAVEASHVTPQRVAAHLAITGLMKNGEQAGEIAGYKYQKRDFQKQHHGRLTLSTGHLSLQSIATGKHFAYALAAMHFGDVDFFCMLKRYLGEKRFKESTGKLWTNFRTASLLAMLRLAQEEFGHDEYGLEHLLPDGRQLISEIVFGTLVRRFLEEYEYLYEENRRVIETLQAAGFELPTELRAAVEFTMGKRFEEEILKHLQSQDPEAYQKAFEIADEVTRHGYRIDRSAVRHIFEEMITKAVRASIIKPSLESLQPTLNLITLATKLGLEANLDHAQEAVYEALQHRSIIPEEICDLAIWLGLAPCLFQPKPELPAADDLHASSTEAILT